jgi:hypothetical protein
MAADGDKQKRGKVVVRNGSLGYLKGDSFVSESNFVITRVVSYIKFGEEKGYLVQVRGSRETSER